MNATGTTNNAKPVTLEDLEKMVKILESAPKPMWTLLAPDGRVWQNEQPQSLGHVCMTEYWAKLNTGEKL